MIRIAVCQAVLDIDSPTSAWQAALRQAAEAAHAGAQLVVLPELANTGYVFANAAELAAAATPLDSDFVVELAALSARSGAVFVAGWAEQAIGGPYNSAVVVDAGRVVGSYRKAHLWDTEKQWFVPGDNGPLVVETTVGHIGVMICYDLEFPEWVRMAREAGADVIVAPVNWPLLPRPADSLPLEVMKACGNAGSYRVPIAIADRAGSERGVDWVGGSCIVGRDGYLLVGPELDGDASLTLTADVELAGDTRLTDRNDVQGDRRPDLYTEAFNTRSR